MTVAGNLFDDIPENMTEEHFQVLTRGRGDFFIERIVSRGHASPEGFWYEQETAEWVVVLSGEGVIEFERGEEMTLRPGSWVEIPPRVRHRVKSTRPDADTVWLAIHWREDTKKGDP